MIAQHAVRFVGVAFLMAASAGATAIPVRSAYAAGSASATAVPPNYRQLVARHLASNLKKWGKLRKASISRPGEGWMGIFQGGNRPIVCATIRAQGPLIEQTYTVGFTFKGGRIEDVFYPGGFNPMVGAVGAALQEALTCGKLTYGPFTELGGAR